MELKVYGNVIEVDGVIKTIADAQEVIDAIKQINGKDIKVIVKDSFALPSSVIGFLIKKNEEGSNITLEVGNEILAELLEDLNLSKIFNLRKI